LLFCLFQVSTFCPWNVPLSMECAAVHAMQFMATTGRIMVTYAYTFHCYLGFQPQN
jgi:hypothetical protein